MFLTKHRSASLEKIHQLLDELESRREYFDVALADQAWVNVRSQGLAMGACLRQLDAELKELVNS